jgi:probable HAF family extracellular repeat protein
MRHFLILALLGAALAACGDPVRPAERPRAAARESEAGMTATFAVTIKDLGTLPGGRQSRAVGNNDKGQVVGWSLDANGVSRAVVWSPTGRIRALPALVQGLGCQANHINESGQAVGRCRIGFREGSPVYRAVLWSPAGQIRNLGTLPGAGRPTSEANDINDAGVVAGSSAAPDGHGGTTHAFRWTAAGGIRDLGVLRQCYTGFSFGYRINKAGQVAGESDACSTEDAQLAVLWSASGAARSLGYFGPPGPGYRFSVAYGLNDLGHAVGYAGATDQCVESPFRWRPATGLERLPLLKQPRSDCFVSGEIFIGTAFAINNADVAVGRSTTGALVGERDPVYHATVWSAAKVVQDLGTLPGGRQSRANDINAHNQVVGWSEITGGRTHAVLWTLR